MIPGPDAIRARLAEARVHLVLTRALCRRDPAEVLRLALDGGVDVVQVREPDATDRDVLAWARVVRAATRAAGAVCVVNDRPDVALLAGADGVHVGQDDLAPAEVRTLLGPAPLIGRSTHDLAQLRAARAEPVDYVGFGPCCDTATKGLRGLGLAEVAEAAGEAAALGIKMFAIGGVGPATIDGLVRAGVRAVAVSSAICGADDPADVARRLRSACGAADRLRGL